MDPNKWSKTTGPNSLVKTDFLRTFSGRSQDFLRTFSGFSQDFLRTCSLALIPLALFYKKNDLWRLNIFDYRTDLGASQIDATLIWISSKLGLTPQQGSRKKGPNPKFFQPEIVQQSAYVRKGQKVFFIVRSKVVLFMFRQIFLKMFFCKYLSFWC